MVFYGDIRTESHCGREPGRDGYIHGAQPHHIPPEMEFSVGSGLEFFALLEAIIRAGNPASPAKFLCWNEFEVRRLIPRRV